MPLFPRSIDSTRTYSTGAKTFSVPVPTNAKLELMLLYNLHKSSLTSADILMVTLKEIQIQATKTREIKTIAI